MKAYKVTGKLGDICSFVGGNEVKKGDMVYLHPERQWVGLTPDEVFGIADQHPVEGFDPDIMAYTRAIEQTLKEKNT